MSVKVRLNDIIDAMESQSEELRLFLNTETGKIVAVSQDALRLADDGEEYDHLFDWQKEEAELAEQIIEDMGTFVEPPSRVDIDEYRMMERFCYALSDEKAETKLLNAIQGRGAFRRFKDKILTLEIEDEWYEYRDAQHRQVAIDFCEQIQIDYVE